jgi:hypothetical protein
MKISSFSIVSTSALCSSTVGAFSVLPHAVKPASSTTVRNMYFAEEDGAGATATKENTIYDRLGFSEDKIAIGINENEVLQWLGK